MKIIHLPLLFLFSSTILIAQNSSWKLKKEKEGIKVHNRSVKNFAINEFKSHAIFNSNIEKIIYAIKDMDNMSKWLADCVSTRLLKEQRNEQIYHVETFVPFPFKNRECIYHSTYTPNDKGMVITIKGLPKYLPLKNDLVRIPYLKGKWVLEKISPTKTSITYQILAKPGGSIPNWLANVVAVDMPYNTLKNLREYLKKDI